MYIFTTNHTNQINIDTAYFENYEERNKISLKYSGYKQNCHYITNTDYYTLK